MCKIFISTLLDVLTFTPLQRPGVMHTKVLLINLSSSLFFSSRILTVFSMFSPSVVKCTNVPWLNVIVLAEIRHSSVLYPLLASSSSSRTTFCHNIAVSFCCTTTTTKLPASSSYNNSHNQEVGLFCISSSSPYQTHCIATTSSLLLWV